jgi:uncharacterized protein
MLARQRWFFCKFSGRRRIGKTTLVQQALPQDGRNVVYLQVPDSAASGFVAAFRDALELVGVDAAVLRALRNLRAMAQAVGELADLGHVGILVGTLMTVQCMQRHTHYKERTIMKSINVEGIPDR